MLKKIYKKFIYFIFHCIYGKIKIQTKNLKFKKFKIKKYKNYYLYKIENGRVFTDNVENVAIIKNNEILKNISFQQIKGKLVNAKFNSVISNGTPKFIKKFNGNILVLAQGASGHSNYCHWLIDIIPKIKLSSEVININKINYFYIPLLNNYQKEILNKIKISPSKFINSFKYAHILGKNIIVPTHPYYQKGYFAYEQSKINKWIIKYLRKTFLNKKKSKIKKIYIDRSDSTSKHCKIINNKNLIKFLKTKGFKIIQLSKISFMQQVIIFKNAKFIIGAHGAGLTNLIFSSPKTKVIEIKPSNHPNKLYKKISNINKLKYSKLTIPKINNNPMGDIFVNLDKLNVMLND